MSETKTILFKTPNWHERWHLAQRRWIRRGTLDLDVVEGCWMTRQKAVVFLKRSKILICIIKLANRMHKQRKNKAKLMPQQDVQNTQTQVIKGKVGAQQRNKVQKHNCPLKHLQTNRQHIVHKSTQTQKKKKTWRTEANKKQNNSHQQRPSGLQTECVVVCTCKHEEASQTTKTL